jgi:hypothetical protein
MYVTSELEIFSDKDELEYYYNKFNFEFIKKTPRYLIYNDDIKDWRYKNWGTETEIKIIHKNLIWDKIEKKLSIRFDTNYPPLKIINYFASKNKHLKLILYYYDFYDYINAEYHWNDGVGENIFLYNNI